MLVELMHGEERKRFGKRRDMEKHRLRKQQRHQQREQRKLSNSGEARDEWTPLPKSMLSVLPDPRRWPTPKAVMIQRAMAPALMANLSTTSEESSPTSLQLLIDDLVPCMPCHVIQLFLLPRLYCHIARSSGHTGGSGTGHASAKKLLQSTLKGLFSTVGGSLRPQDPL